MHYRPDRVGDLSYRGVAANVLHTNLAGGVQFDLSRPLGAAHTLRAGLFAERERGSVANASTVFSADGDGNQTRDVPLTINDDSKLAGRLFGVYLPDEWQPTRALTLNYGLRYDQVSTVLDEAQLGPRLGIVYPLAESTRRHAGYSRYFTPLPTEKIDTASVQKFLGTTNALPSDANPAVRSERSNCFDLGVSHQLDSRITLGADACYRRVSHLQDEGQFGNALIYSAFNCKQGRTFGLELSGSYKAEQLSAYANPALSSARGKGIETGQFNFGADELAYIANHWVHLDHEQTVAASVGLSYRLDGGLVLGGDLRYGSGLRRSFANSAHLPRYVQANASVAHAIEWPGVGRFDVRLSALNLFDRVDQLRDGSGIGVGAPQFAQRRAVYLALSKPFRY